MYCIAGIEMSFHRIGRADWSPGPVLRSWAEAPWLPTDPGVAIACLPSDVIWLGLTAASRSLRATVSVHALPDGAVRLLRVPDEWQLGWLLDRQGRAVPLALHDAASTTYRVAIDTDGAQHTAMLKLALLSPPVWARRFGRVALAQAERPPSVPLYSRIARPAESDRDPPS